MKRLYLLRHAKAMAPQPELEDHLRALSVRGMHDAGLVARHLRKSGQRPELLLVSSAARTVQTAALVLGEIAARAEYRDALYLAEAGKLLAAVQGVPATVASLMLVGHNPGIEMLASLLAREKVAAKERARRDVLEEKFPTAALAVLDFDIGKWRAVAPGQGRLVEFVRPRDL